MVYSFTELRFLIGEEEPAVCYVWPFEICVLGFLGLDVLVGLI